MLVKLRRNNREEALVAGHSSLVARKDVASHDGEEGILREEFDDATLLAFGEVVWANFQVAPSASFNVEDGVELV